MQTGVNYPNQRLENAPVIFQGSVTVGNAGGVFTAQDGVSTALGGPTTIAGARADYVMSALVPGDTGLKAWSFPVKDATGTGSAVTVAGTVYLSSLHLSAGVTYGTIYLKVQANGGTASAGSNFAGLYNSSGVLVATTADISIKLGTTGGTTGYFTLPLATAYTPTTSGQHWVGAFFNASAAGSLPQLYCMANFVTVTTSAGVGVNGIAAPNGAAPFPYATIATTSATAMPASFTLGSAVNTGAYVFWCGAS